MRADLKKMTVEEYFNFENTSDVRHEYFDAKLYTMPYDFRDGRNL
jgi:hypothetical protein